MPITGFELLTKVLNSKDLATAHIIAEGLLLKQGEDMAVTNKAIRAGLKETRDIVVSAIKVRQIIQMLRECHIVVNLVSFSKGYYITQEPRELRKYIQSREERRRAMQRVDNALKVQLESLILSRQPTLFDG